LSSAAEFALETNRYMCDLVAVVQATVDHCALWAGNRNG